MGNQHTFVSDRGRPARAFRDGDACFIDDGREVRLSRLQAPEILRLAGRSARLESALRRLLDAVLLIPPEAVLSPLSREIAEALTEAILTMEES